MWTASGNEIKMVVGDFGIQLPITINGTTLAQGDELLFTLKKSYNRNTVLTKTFSNISENTINLELTEEESANLVEGAYVYSLDWYQDGVFMCNIIPASVFRVVSKA